MNSKRVLFFLIIVCIYVYAEAFSVASAGEFVRSEFSLEIPENWFKMEEYKADGVEAVFAKKVDAEIAPIVMIAIDKHAEGKTIEDVVSTAVNIVTSQIPGAKFLFERDVYTGKVKWREIIYQYSDAGYSFQVVQYHTIKNKRHYAFTGQSLQSDFSGYLGDFRRTFSTWEFRSN